MGTIACDKSRHSQPAASRPATPAGAATTQEPAQTAPAAPQVLWRYAATAGFETTPAVTGESIFLGDQTGTLHALNATTGKLRWTQPLGRRLTSPPVVRDGVVYVGDLDGIFHAVDGAGGQERWTFTCRGAIWAAATLIEGGLLVADESGQVVRLDGQGTLLWKWQGGGRINAAAALWRDQAIFAGCDGAIHGLALADGAERLSISLDGPAGAMPLLIGDTAIIGVAGGKIQAVNLATGKQEWSFEGPSADMVYASPVLCAEAVVVAIGDQVVSLDQAGGRQRWLWQAPASIEAAMTIQGQQVHIALLDGHVFTLDGQTGQPRARWAAGAAISAGPVVQGGRILIADRQGVVYYLAEIF
jgi:outer membrane protein assembly factor BamB